jgi:hypothetical protein
MRGAIPPFSHTSSRYDARLSTGTTLSLPLPLSLTRSPKLSLQVFRLKLYTRFSCTCPSFRHANVIW